MTRITFADPTRTGHATSDLEKALEGDCMSTKHFRRRRSVLAVASLATASILVSACSSGSEAEVKATEDPFAPVTLKVSTFDWQSIQDINLLLNVACHAAEARTEQPSFLGPFLVVSSLVM